MPAKNDRNSVSNPSESTPDAGKIRAVIDDLKALQKTHVLGGLSVGSPFSVFAIEPARLSDASRATVMDIKAG